MMNSLDLLVIVFMVMAAAALLSLTLMFLARRSRLKQICLYIASALGVYTGYAGIRIGSVFFPMKAAVGVLAAITAIGAAVLERIAKGNNKKLIIARIMAAASVIVGMVNAIL